VFVCGCVCGCVCLGLCVCVCVCVHVLLRALTCVRVNVRTLITIIKIRLKFDAVCCSVLQYVTVCRSVLDVDHSSLNQHGCHIYSTMKLHVLDI